MFLKNRAERKIALSTNARNIEISFIGRIILPVKTRMCQVEK